MLDGCLLLFAVAAVTDWLDGYLARKRNQVTSLGRILDPFVDKVLVCGAFVLFSGPGFVDAELRNITAVAPWMVVIILGRELLVTGLRGFSEARGRAFGADLFGKAKTVVQMITACWIMLYVAHIHSADRAGFIALAERATTVLVWLSIAVTALSGLNYLYKARDALFLS